MSAAEMSWRGLVCGEGMTAPWARRVMRRVTRVAIMLAYGVNFKNSVLSHSNLGALNKEEGE